MTNKFLLIPFIIGSFLFYSCDDSSEPEESETVVNYSDKDQNLFDFQAFSLTPYQINALIYLPDETADIGAATDPNIEHELDDYKWDIFLGQNFHMRILDWGEDDGIAVHKEELEELSHIYDVEFIEDTPDFIYYKRTLKAKAVNDAGKSVGVNHVTYHCLGNHRIDGINYVFRSNDDGIPKPIAEYMIKSIKSVEEIRPT